MSFLEKYLIEPFKYATSDRLKVLIVILLLGIPIVIISISLIAYIKLNFSTFILTLGIGLLFFIITSMAITGYYIGVVKNTLKGLDTLPDWSNFIEILKDGVLYTVALFILILLAYLPAILLLIIGIFFTGAIATVDSFRHSDLWTIITSLLAYILVLLLYMLVVSIALKIYVPLATVNFAKKGFSGFFKFSDVLKKISFEYILILLLYFVINFIFNFILETIANIIVPMLDIFISIIVISIYIMCNTIMSFIFGIMSYRAVTKYYLEREKEQ
ncbi:hypothetical protein CFE53_03660 [Methanofervidicoccus sp. A16]|uniref:DUF4013 domain-containing protein n=1 Tax=Methanofervidicoccus sp. A16 TaxID=2607662 RepID=UPI00118CDE1D|nr:DUF4013 domain-containing protein [Methanofervidicoccus sp. A16]AXI25283.1 hypothetical protein CFE53_03660 [Methanofervidicoccus sp. A16]